MRLAYRSWHAESAAAPLALLLHGATGSAETWWRVGPALAAAGWRVVAFDLRGHGANPRAEGRYTVEDLAGDVEGTIDALRLEGVDVIWGHSLGALVALRLLTGEVPVARRVILEDPPDSRADGWVAYAPQVRAERSAVLNDPTQHLRRLLTEQPRWTDADAAVAIISILSCDTEALAQSSERGLDYNTLAMLRQLRVPALLMLASPSHSVMLAAERRDSIAALSRGAVIEFDSGHVVHRDQFDQAIATAITWLGKAGQEAGEGAVSDAN